MDDDPTSRALKDLKEASTVFEENYEYYIKMNPQQGIIKSDEGIQMAIDKAGKSADMKRSAKIFGNEILMTLNAMEKKTKMSDLRWTSKLGNFLSKLYPVAMLSLSFTGVIAEVLHRFSLFLTLRVQISCHWKEQRWVWGFYYKYIHPFIQLADHKIISDEAGRGGDFYIYLKRIEYQAARIAENPNFDLDSESTRDLMKEKSIDLMIAMVRFFNSALLYFKHDFFGWSLCF